MAQGLERLRLYRWKMNELHAEILGEVRIGTGPAVDHDVVSTGGESSAHFFNGGLKSPVGGRHATGADHRDPEWGHVAVSCHLDHPFPFL